MYELHYKAFAKNPELSSICKQTVFTCKQSFVKYCYQDTNGMNIRHTKLNHSEQAKASLLKNKQDWSLCQSNCRSLKSSNRHWMVSSGVSPSSWGEGATLALVGHPSSDGITIKVPYVVDVSLHRPVSRSIFSYWIG